MTQERAPERDRSLIGEESGVFGLPGVYGMDQFDQADLPRPTRWDFGSG